MLQKNQPSLIKSKNICYVSFPFVIIVLQVACWLELLPREYSCFEQLNNLSLAATFQVKVLGNPRLTPSPPPPRWLHMQQESIPVGCLPPASWPLCPGVRVRRGGGERVWDPWGECVSPGRCVSRGCTYPLPWTEGMTHACENITFPQLLLWAVKMDLLLYRAFRCDQSF